MKRAKFDGFANAYDSWFMQNENLFNSELLLFKKAIGDITGKKVLSVGCGSGLFESQIENKNIEGIEPSVDMAEIAKKRGLNVKIATAEDMLLEDNGYDLIYFNGSSSYIENLKPIYEKCYKALKSGGRLVLIDVPKESAFGFMYMMAKAIGTFEHEDFKGTTPELVYPLELVKSGYWHSTEEKIDILKEIGIDKFEYYQTLINNPLYTNDEIEEVCEGYKKGGYVAIVGTKTI